MAAGRGLRMSPLTDAIPKPMAPFNGSTLIARGIDLLINRLEKIHVTVGYKGAVLAQHVIEHGVCSVFNTEGRGNSWWLYNTLLRHLDEPIYVLTCDNVVELDFDLIEADYKELNEPACMIVPVRPVDGLAGDYIFHNDGLVTELSRKRTSDIYCSGIQILNPKVTNNLTSESDSFYSVWAQLMEQKQLMTSSVYPKDWFAVDTLEQLTELNRRTMISPRQ